MADLSVPLWASAWTADSSKITADTTFFSADGADLQNGGGTQVPEVNTTGQLAVTTSSILKLF